MQLFLQTLSECKYILVTRYACLHMYLHIFDTDEILHRKIANHVPSFYRSLKMNESNRVERLLLNIS